MCLNKFEENHHEINKLWPTTNRTDHERPMNGKLNTQ